MVNDDEAPPESRGFVKLSDTIPALTVQAKRQRETAAYRGFPRAGSTTASVRLTPDRLASLVGATWVDVCQPAAGLSAA